MQCDCSFPLTLSRQSPSVVTLFSILRRRVRLQCHVSGLEAPRHNTDRARRGDTQSRHDDALHCARRLESSNFDIEIVFLQPRCLSQAEISNIVILPPNGSDLEAAISSNHR